MRVLLIKTSSMGDLLHTLPALSDAARALPGIRFDWVAEESFAEIPAWHPDVDRVIPVALRRWRKKLWLLDTWREVSSMKTLMAEEDYDLILDAQGLVKSAWLTWLLKGKRAGLSWRAARESFASVFYQCRYFVNPKQHAVRRMRLLFASALGYDMPTTAPDFKLTPSQFLQKKTAEPYLVFLHGTTWASKQWPEAYWVSLAQQASAAGYRVKVSGGNTMEVARARRIAERCDAVDVLPFLSISSMASLLAGSKGAVAVDTGFGHLAGAMNIPVISLYGATDASLTGVSGPEAENLKAIFPCSPCLNRECTYRGTSAVKPACYETIPPANVWQAMQALLKVLA